MELIAVLLYLWLRQATELFFDYLRSKLKEPPPPINTQAIGFEIPSTTEGDDV